MTDREKVIKGLECCVRSDSEAECPTECPYYRKCWEDDYPDGKLALSLHKDALKLLKEEEPIKPTLKVDEDGIHVWCCGSCGAYLYHIYNGMDKARSYAKYCRLCRRTVKWDE